MERAASIRNHTTEYRATWPDLPRKKEFTLEDVTVAHDETDARKEIKITANIFSPSPNNDLFSNFETRFSTLGVIVISCEFRVTQFPIGEHCRLTLSKPGLQFKLPKDPIRFINQLAALFRYPPVLSQNFKKVVLRRDVRVKFMSDELRWMDEAEWLASSVGLEAQLALETAFAQAWIAMHKEGQAIRITLHSSLDSRSAAMLNDTYGVTFVFSQENRNKLIAVEQEEYRPEPITITLEYRKRPSGVRQLARILAPHLASVESVDIES